MQVATSLKNQFVAITSGSFDLNLSKDSLIRISTVFLFVGSEKNCSAVMVLDFEFFSLALLLRCFVDTKIRRA